MKKLIILLMLAILVSINTFAQSPGSWKVKVEWQVTTNSTCQFQDLVNDRFYVSITIYDEANNITVVSNKSKEEPNDATISIIDVQQELEAHCNDSSLNNVPTYIIYTAVRMVNKQTHYVYCMEKDPGQTTTCNEMSTSGYIIPTIYFE